MREVEEEGGCHLLVGMKDDVGVALIERPYILRPRHDLKLLDAPDLDADDRRADDAARALTSLPPPFSRPCPHQSLS